MYGQTDSINVADNVGPQELFSLANTAYKENDFEKSAELYEKILLQGMESAEVYFNLGNAYFKTGNIPSAILYYEKAKKLNPGNEDITSNLRMANLKTIDKVESKPEMMLTTWWEELLNSYTVDEWGKMSIYLSFISLFVMLGFILFRGLIRKISFFTSVGIFVLSMVFFFMGFQQKSLQTSENYGIIFSPTVTVKSSPENDGTRLFVIHEGTKVKVISEFEDWTEITLMNGSKGWVKSDTFKTI